MSVYLFYYEMLPLKPAQWATYVDKYQAILWNEKLSFGVVNYIPTKAMFTIGITHYTLFILKLSQMCYMYLLHFFGIF